MAIEEYYVVATEQEVVAHAQKLTWNGAVTNAEIAQPSSGKPVKSGHVFHVQAESAEEAIHGVRQVFPGFVSGKCFGILKSSTTEI